ncbi:hypothetical protein Cgig2_012443 [Carnegiea gigantea]|uniref:Thiol-disulfide oxidoreductase DCC n=1 Tax=Carnegiea gigantea TaxID=171969 RepID=A0A9Q1KMA3_9CARY|nr:hypothetical protein Cgig2_012443 [Carnegiea gigantea]
MKRGAGEYGKQLMAASVGGGLSVAAKLPRRHYRPPMAAARGSGAVNWVAETSNFFDRDSRPIMLFDGVCNLCNSGVKFVRDNDHNRLITDFALGVAGRRIRYEPLQSEAGRKLLRRSGRAPDDISSVVLVETDRSYIKSEAVLKIMEYLDLPFPQLAFFLHLVPLFIRDLVYDNIANNRYNLFGKTETCDI